MREKEALPNEDRYDLILASEVLEHVSDPAIFLAACGTRLAPGGMMFLSTINQSRLASMLVVGVAEQMLALVPPGTHDPQKFVSPSQIEQIVRDRLGPSYQLSNVQGVAYVPLLGRWHKIPSCAVNYFATIKQQQG